MNLILRHQFCPGARGRIYLSSRISPEVRGWICYWSSRFSPGVSSCWSHASHTSSLVSPIVPPAENPPAVLQPQSCSPPHMHVPLLTSTPHHSHKKPSNKPQRGPPSKCPRSPKISQRNSKKKVIEQIWVFTPEGVREILRVFPTKTGGAIPGFETPIRILCLLKKIHLGGVRGNKCGFSHQKGLGGCLGYILPRGGGAIQSFETFI